MSLHPRAGAAVLAAVLAAGVLLAGCGDAATSPGSASGSGRAAAPSGRGVPPTPNVTALADAAALGRWRPSPIQPSPAFASSAETACRATGKIGDLPLAVLDARGQGLAILVFASGPAAVVCHAAIDPSGAATADARGVAGIAEATPPEPLKLGIHDLEPITSDANPRVVVVGQVGDGVSEVSVNFDDATWSHAAVDNGWYATWWPSVAEALGIAAVNSRNTVIDSFAP